MNSIQELASWSYESKDNVIHSLVGLFIITFIYNFVDKRKINLNWKTNSIKILNFILLGCQKQKKEEEKEVLAKQPSKNKKQGDSWNVILFVFAF